MTYDAAGNLTNDGQGSTYTYDAENRLTATTATAGYSYVYDGDGKRVKKCSNSGCTTGKLYWTGMGSDPLAESGVGGSNTEEYVFFNGKRVARRDVSNLAVHYYFSDHLGSASVITDNLGTLQKEADYYPFGGESVVSGSDINNYKFTGKERDTESALDNFGARYNASSLGRFMSSDSTQLKRNRLFEPQRLNLYAYSVNNPLSFVDPDGKDAIAISFQDAHYHGLGAIFGNQWWSLGHAGIVTVDSKGHAVYFDKNQSGVHKEDLGPVKLEQ